MLSSRIKDKVKGVLENRSFIDTNGFFIAYPNTVSDLKRLIKLAGREKIKIKIMGTGSSLSSDHQASEQTLYISSRKLVEVIKFDQDFGYLTVQSGITLSEVEDILENIVWFLPVEVDKYENNTLGGFVACLRSFSKFGTMIHGLKLILSSGEEVVWGGEFHPGSSGYNLSALITGTFGQFGFISELTLKLVNFSALKIFNEKCSHLKTDNKNHLANSSFVKLKKDLDPEELIIPLS